MASDGVDLAYHPRRPDKTALYRILQEHWLTFEARAEAFGKGVPGFVRKEFEEFLRCGILAYGFCRVHCAHCRKDRVVAWSCRGRGFCPSCMGRRMAEVETHLCDEVVGVTPLRQWVLTLPKPMRYLLAYNASVTTAVLNIFINTISHWLKHKAKQALALPSARSAYPGSITAIQRHGSAADLNVHFHALVMVTDGVFVTDATSRPVFHVLPQPAPIEIADLAWQICTKTIDYLRAHDLWLDAEDKLQQDEPLLAVCAQAAINGRILFGSGNTSGRLKLLPPQNTAPSVQTPGHGFNLHAGTTAKANDTLARKRLTRYVVRPPIANERLDLLADGRVRLRLKRPYSDGTTHILLDPLDFIARLVALVPPPRTHQLRFHGVYAPNHRLRAAVIPTAPAASPSKHAPKPKRYTWARLLKSTFGFDVLKCPRCRNTMVVLAAIVDGVEVRRVLAHLGLPTTAPLLHPARAPPSSAWDAA